MFRSQPPREELEERVVRALERTGALEERSAAAIAQLRDASAVSATVVEQVLGRLAAAAERIAALEGELAARRDALVRLAEAQARIEALEAELAAQPEPAAAEPWAGAERHLLFVVGPDGYELVEREGPPPSVGDVVDGRVVGRVTRAPVPGGTLPCAYLVG